MVHGFKEGGFVSLEAVGYTGAYLRHHRFVCYVHQWPKTTNLGFEADASFKLVHLDGDKVRFEASNFPGHFITAREDGSVILARDSNTAQTIFVLKSGSK